GPGGGDFAVSDLFVPQDQVNPGFYGPPRYDRALFRIKEMPEIGHGAHALGIASGAMAAFTAAVTTRPAAASPRPDARVRAARALLHQTAREAYADAQDGDLSLELRVRLREANIFTVRS